MMKRHCEKVKFSSREFAEFHIEKHKESNKAKGLKARAYLCKCGSFHITSKPLISDVIKELNLKIEDLEINNEALKEQLIEQIRKNVDLKAEVDILKQFRHNRINEPNDVKILKQKLNKEKEKVVEQRKHIVALLNKLENVR